ncbi:protein-tyrosine phosphatase-like protein [Lentinula guzmanii]|uniref:protein-tyrosine-phosphatase n=1 Tax=Lentinula guzmanii TaxID=2804957 RepID=A0AA38MTM5_9AGAR|nr:protein-tyrosine phosphatase-like protein [Lentinula guzmanii]
MSAWTSIAQKHSSNSVERASLIIPRLYLSDFSTAMDEEIMLKLGVTHVVSVLDWSPEFLASIPAPHRLHISLRDLPTADILAHLDSTTRFVKAALEENESNVVLVHCFQGVSRSATVVCAYLISTAGMTAMESITFVQSKRRIVSPNNGFRKQLHSYATSIRESTALKVTVENSSFESTKGSAQLTDEAQKTEVSIGRSSESPW